MHQRQFSMSLEAIKEQLEKHVDELGEQAMAGSPAHAGFFAITAFSVSYGGMLQAFLLLVWELLLIEQRENVTRPTPI